MPIKLDWRFTNLTYPAEIRMKQLWNLYNHSQRNFSDAMKAWEQEGDGLNEEEEAMHSDYLIEKRDAIEGLFDRGHTLGIVGLYTFLESFLNLVVDSLREAGASFTGFKDRFDLHALKGHLESIGVRLDREPFDWPALDQFREIRNCIVHTDGHITPDFVTRFAAVGLAVTADSQLQIPDDYFERCWNLVNETYQQAHKQCWEKFGYGKQRELWMRPTRKFTSDEVRQIIQEAISAGIAARDEAKAHAAAEAQREGRTYDGSCGWAWIELDPKLLKHIHKLDIPKVRTSYNTTAIVEDFYLYLEDVRDYNYMGPASIGMEAAVEIFRKHGINSVVHSLAD